MEWAQIFKKPFIIPSLFGGLLVLFRIFLVFYQYALKKVRRRRQEQARKNARAARKRTDNVPISPGRT
jgi:hypothetical protein